MSNQKISDGRIVPVSKVLAGRGRAILELLRLRKPSDKRSRIRTIISWVPLYVLGLYMVDYAETRVGLGIGLQELNPLISNLANLFGVLAFPIVFLLVAGAMYALAGQYRGYPRLVPVIALLVAGNETANVTMNMVYILHMLGLLR